MTSSIHHRLFEAAVARTWAVVVGSIPAVVGIPVVVDILEVVLADSMPKDVSISFDSQATKMTATAAFVLILVFLV